MKQRKDDNLRAMKYVVAIGLLLGGVVVYLTVNQFFFCTQYVFPDSKHFYGSSIYNPYADLVNGQWMPGNFHAHTRCWFGLTNGKGTPEELYKAYKRGGYEIAAVSNYHSISMPSDQLSLISLPVYEHGYNPTKTHHLLIGGGREEWRDYLLPQTISNKQQALEKFNPNEIVVLCHPSVRNGFSLSNMENLTNYDYIEILNSHGHSLEYWDAALSSGRAVFGMANDDSHNASDPEQVGKYCTQVFAQKNNASVMSALREGKSYSVKIGWLDESNHVAISNLPVLIGQTIKNDSLHVAFSIPGTITFIGENGVTLAKFQNTTTGCYQIKESDSYVRVEAAFDHETEIFLNPVFRYHTTNPLRQQQATVDHTTTALLRLTGAAILLGIALVANQIFPRKKRPRLPLPSGNVRWKFKLS